MSNENKKEILARGLDYPDFIMRFFAEKSKQDANGNDIVGTYARKTAVQELEEQGTRQNERITENAEEALEAKQTSQNTQGKVISIEGKVLNAEDAQTQLLADFNVAKAQIERMETEARMSRKDKGLFATLVQLNSVSPNEGDYAMLMPPAEDAELEDYFGDKYIGIKSEHTDDWAENGQSAKGCIYVGDDDVVYKVVKGVTFATLVEPHHTEDTELVEDGIIEELTYGGSPYIVACVEDGKWTVTEARATFGITPHVLTENVLDGEATQEQLNLTSRANGFVGNSNLTKIENAINAIAETLNELQTVVAVQRESDKLPLFINKIKLSDYRIAGDLHRTLIGISPMPIITVSDEEAI
jgi:hypothetical protein